MVRRVQLDLSTLADTTVLLLFVFTIVNIAVLVVRRERVEHEHFTAPSVFSVLGASCPWR